LAIMSDFKLDIDYPYEIIKKENLHTVPESVPYQASPIKYRHYGKIMEEMLKKGGVDARWTRKECIGFHAGESYEKVVLSME